ncbi:MAG TPA: hypothetical protein DIS74_06200 [Bacteroidales bacterium]|nr:hypothetical protein [Bacteroidales bacterium]
MGKERKVLNISWIDNAAAYLTTIADDQSESPETTTKYLPGLKSSMFTFASGTSSNLSDRTNSPFMLISSTPLINVTPLTDLTVGRAVPEN